MYPKAAAAAVSLRVWYDGKIGIKIFVCYPKGVEKTSPTGEINVTTEET